MCTHAHGDFNRESNSVKRDSPIKCSYNHGNEVISNVITNNKAMSKLTILSCFNLTTTWLILVTIVVTSKTPEFPPNTL